MIYNTVIDHLRKWCIDKARVHLGACTGYGGVADVVFRLVNELAFKLSTLIDKSFESDDTLKAEILNLIDVHYEPSLIKPENKSAEIQIDKTNRKLIAYMDELLQKGEALAPSGIPYQRVIVGREAASLIERFRSIWKYENTSYWYPLIGDEPNEIQNKFYIMYDRFKPYADQLKQRIGLPNVHIYGYGEEFFFPEHCIETTEPDAYGGCEMFYTDTYFSWAIYFSHENTVSFAGTIVPTAQELLAGEKAYWNQYKME